MKKDQSLINRSLSTVFFLVACLPTCCFCQSYDLVHQFDANSTLKVQTQLQYQGSVIVDSAGNDENQRALPLDVRADLKFDQRISSGSTNQIQAIRYFDQANAEIKAGKGSTEVKLADEKRLILACQKKHQNGNHVLQIAGIENTLTQKEYELLKTPGDSLVFSNLFNKTGVKVGDKWEPSKDLIADLVAINRVTSCNVEMSLKSVDGNTAKVYIYGRVRGESDDALTEMNLKGIALISLSDRLVTSLRMTIDEERRAGQFAPGFEGKIKLDSRLARTDHNPLLDKQRLAKIYQGKKVKFNFLMDSNDSQFRLFHKPEWRIIASQKDAAVLRLIDDGKLVAQCNIVELPKRPADNPLSLQAFKDEIKKITSASEGAEISHSDVTSTASGLQALLVKVDGLEQQIPFSWLYYHVAANDGRRVTFVFTFEKAAEEYFGNADRELINEFVFKANRSASQTKTLPKKTR